MRYKQFLTTINGEEKRLGILGECHLYTTQESRFAEEIVLQFENFAVEGTSKASVLGVIADISMLPAYICLSGIPERSPDNATALQFARLYQLMTFELEDQYRLTSLRAGAFVICGVTDIVESPFAYFWLKKNGDPYTPGTKAYAKLKEQKEKPTLLSRIADFATDVEGRDIKMALRSFEVLKTVPKNLLVSVGDHHLDGIVSHWHRMLPLEETRSVSEEEVAYKLCT